MALHNPPADETVSFTLREFNRKATSLLDGVDDADFMRFCLCGEFDEDDQVKHAFLDPVQDVLDEDYPLTIRRDYDSLLGIGHNIFVQTALSVYSVPNPFYALKTSIHIQHLIDNPGTPGHGRYVDYHTIPNFELGTFGGRHHLNIFFPRLWNDDRASEAKPYHLRTHERRLWYEHGLRPAIGDLLGRDVVSEWPATYETECLRARQPNGKYSWSQKRVPADKVRNLANAIRYRLRRNNNGLTEAERDWAANFFVLHTIRGEKHSSFHRVDQDSAVHYLRRFLFDSGLDLQAANAGSWYIDVGVEISSDLDDCLQWLTPKHATIVQQALQISDQNAAALTDIGSSKYARDLSSHLTAVSGFRAVPGARTQGNYEACYIQAYTTDKAVVYNPDGRHHAKYLTTKDSLGKVQPCENLVALHTIYDEARVANASSARIEVRVPFQFATSVLMRFDPAEIRQSLCAFTCDDWWSFRKARLTAISKVFSLQLDAPNVKRFTPNALILNAACVWLANGLHARPEDGPAARRLMDVALPITGINANDVVNRDILAYKRSTVGRHQRDGFEGDDLEDEVDDVLVPYIPYGCIFFRQIRFNDIPRFPVGPPFPPSAFKYWFYKLTVREIAEKYRTTGLVDQIAFEQFRNPNKKKTKLFLGPPEPELFNLGARGYTIPEDEDGEAWVDPLSGDAPTLDAFVTRLYRQFISDVIIKSPNPRDRDRPSYLKRSLEEDEVPSDDMFAVVNLPDLFTDVQYRPAPKADWDRALNWCFPPYGAVRRKKTQYSSCRYYQMWLDFVDRSPDQRGMIEATRKAIFRKIQGWKWIPDAHQDRLWTVSFRKNFKQWPAVEVDGPGPRILMRETARATFDLAQNE